MQQPSFPSPRAPRPRFPGVWKGVVVAFALVPAIVSAGLFVPTDRYALSPGPAEEVGRLIRVEGSRAASKGAFLLTTVSVTVDTISIFEAVRAAIDPAIEMIPKEALVGKGLTDEEQDQINRGDMEESKLNASIVAATIAGLTVPKIPGARVIIVLKGRPAENVLKEGDVITAVGGKAVKNAGEMSAEIQRHPPGTALRFDLLRDERTMTVIIKTATEQHGGQGDGTKRSIIGIITGPAYRLPVDIDIDSQDIVGPSAGLMFTLAVADALTDEDLTHGYRIAGTGTIDLEGNVGQIGGVGQKVRAAEYAGADIFLSPPEDFREAKATARSIKVYSVATIKDAVELLERLDPPKAG